MIKSRFSVGAIILLICAVVLAGCAVARPQVENMPPPDVSSILTTLRMRHTLVDSLSTWMNVKYESDGQETEVGERLYYQKSGKLRVDIMGPLKAPKAIALVAEDSFRIYFVTENEVIMGDLSDGVIKEIFDIDLRVSDMLSSIFANPFLDGNVDDLEAEGYGDEWILRRSSTLSGHREEISILARNTTVTKWRVIDSEGNVTQEIAFSRYQKVGGILRPLKAVIDRPSSATRISIECVNPEINVELAEATFNLPIPEGAKIVQFSDPGDFQALDTEQDQ